MLEKLAKSIEEINVLAEHYRECQDVAAVESLAKEHAISKEDTDAFIAGKRNFLLPVPLVQNSESVAEKLTEEMFRLEDSGYATVIGSYLLNLANKDLVMKDVILQPHKTLQRCIEYVHEKAYETALERAKKEGKTGVGQNAGIAIGSTEVFAWVIENVFKAAINESTPEDAFLSDQIYYYDRHIGKILKYEGSVYFNAKEFLDYISRING